MARFDVPEPDLYRLNPHLSDAVNHNIIQSEIDGGIYLRDVPCGAVLEIQTHAWNCTMIYCGDREALVSGHPRLCPEWVRVYVSGSTWGGSMLKEAFIGRGMHLEFLHPVHQRVITSVIADVRVRELVLDQTNAAAAEVGAGDERTP